MTVIICLGCHLCDTEFKQNKFHSPEFYTKSIYDLKKRDNMEWRRIASEVTPGTHDRGIKGTCQLMRLHYVDLTVICPPEPMHSMYLGNIPLFYLLNLTLIFEKVL